MNHLENSTVHPPQSGSSSDREMCEKSCGHPVQSRERDQSQRYNLELCI